MLLKDKKYSWPDDINKIYKIVWFCDSHCSKSCILKARIHPVDNHLWPTILSVHQEPLHSSQDYQGSMLLLQRPHGYHDLLKLKTQTLVSQTNLSVGKQHIYLNIHKNVYFILEWLYSSSMFSAILYISVWPQSSFTANINGVLQSNLRYRQHAMQNETLFLLTLC